MDQSIEIVDIVSLKDKDSPYLKPFRVLYKQNSEKILSWDCIKTHDSVAVLIYNISRNVIVLVRQFRPPVLLSILFNHMDASFENLKEKSKEVGKEVGFTIELCAGIIDKPGLSEKEIAREEVIEETGYNPPIESLQLITSFRTGVGSSGALQHVFYCQVDDSMKITSGGGVDDECIDVLELPVEEARKHIFENDEISGIGRTSGLRFALLWFMTEKLPQITKSKS